MRDGPFNLWWFWYALFAILVTTVVALAILTVADRSALQRTAEAQAAEYTPPPIALNTTAPKTVAFVGDSYSVGTGATDQAHRFVNLLAGHERWAYTNFANGGTGYVTAATQGQRACGTASCPAYSEVLDKVKQYRPDIVVVSGGRNDVGQSESRVRSGVQKFYEDLRTALPKAKIIAVSPIWDDDPAPAQLTSIANAVKNSVTSVDGSYLSIGEPLAGQPGKVVSDGVHPNNAGHAAIAAAIESRLD